MQEHSLLTSTNLVARFEIGHTPRKKPTSQVATSRFNAYLLQSRSIIIAHTPLNCNRFHFFIFRTYPNFQRFFCIFYTYFNIFTNNLPFLLVPDISDTNIFPFPCQDILSPVFISSSDKTVTLTLSEICPNNYNNLNLFFQPSFYIDKDIHEKMI